MASPQSEKKPVWQQEKIFPADKKELGELNKNVSPDYSDTPPLHLA